MQHQSVSIVIPARNAAASIAGTIEAALAQDYPGAIEVVVAVGPSSDGTREVVARFGDPVRVIDNPSGTTPDALNRAIAASGGEVIARCDAHAVLPPGYVSRAVATLIATGAVNVGGVQHALGTTFFQRAVAIAQSTPVGVGDARYRLGGEAGPVDTVYLGVFRRDALEQAGGFDRRFERNQDYELNWRLREAGGLVWFDPGLQVAYSPRNTPTALARQYFEYGRWKRLMLRHHPRSVRPRQLAAPLLVAGLAVSALLAVTPWRPLGLVIPGAYGLVLEATAIVEGLRRRQPAALLLPLVIPTMHLSWGVGFLVPQSSAAR